MTCTECNSYFFTATPIDDVCPECYDMNHNNGGHGFDELEDSNNEDFDRFEDDILEQQERDDFDETDEAYGRFDYYDHDEPYDNDIDFGMHDN